MHFNDSFTSQYISMVPLQANAFQRFIYKPMHFNGSFISQYISMVPLQANAFQRFIYKPMHFNGSFISQYILVVHLQANTFQGHVTKYINLFIQARVADLQEYVDVLKGEMETLKRKEKHRKVCLLFFLIKCIS